MTHLIQTPNWFIHLIKTLKVKYLTECNLHFTDTSYEQAYCKNKLEYKCTRCLKTDSTISWFKRHKNECKNTFILFCNHCNYKTNKKTNLAYHIWTKHPLLGSNNLECLSCDRSFKELKYLLHHVKRCSLPPHISMKLAPLLVCDICKCVTRYKHYLSRHMRQKHGPKPANYECDNCGRLFLSDWGLKGHKKKTCTVEGKDNSSLTSSEKRVKYVKPACTKCKKRFSYIAGLKKHSFTCKARVENVTPKKVCSKNGKSSIINCIKMSKKSILFHRKSQFNFLWLQIFHFYCIFVIIATNPGTCYKKKAGLIKIHAAYVKQGSNLNAPSVPRCTKRLAHSKDTYILVVIQIIIFFAMIANIKLWTNPTSKIIFWQNTISNIRLKQDRTNVKNVATVTNIVFIY